MISPLFTEENIFHWIFLVTVEHFLIYVKFCFYSITVFHLSGFIPVVYCFDYGNLVIQFKIRTWETSTSVLCTWACFRYWSDFSDLFSYLYEIVTGYSRTHWNCRSFPSYGHIDAVFSTETWVIVSLNFFFGNSCHLVFIFEYSVWLKWFPLIYYVW